MNNNLNVKWLVIFSVFLLFSCSDRDKERVTTIPSPQQPTPTVSQTIMMNSVEISLEYTPEENNSWRVEYSLMNAGTESVSNIRLRFPLEGFSNLEILSAPDGWQAIAVQSDFLLEERAVYEVFTVNAQLEQNQTLSGYSFTFDWDETGTPSAEDFEVISVN